MKDKNHEKRRVSDALKPKRLDRSTVRRVPPTDEPVKQPLPVRLVDQQQRESPGNRKPTSQSDLIKRDLAKLLWGQPEEEVSSPPPKKETPSVSGGKAYEAQDAGTRRRTSNRRDCNFPGLLRILIPEQTFQPKIFAIRLTDISPYGARMVTRQLTHSLAEAIRREKRFARIEVMIPAQEKLVMPGRIAWVEHHPELSQIGFQFEQEFRQVDSLFIADVESSERLNNLRIPAPRVDPFPAVTGKSTASFTGHAPDAEMVLVRNGVEEWKTDVSGGHFHVEVSLSPERSNFVSFTALKAGARSLPTPVCIVHRSGADASFAFRPGEAITELEVDDETRSVSLAAGGSAVQIQSLLRELEKVANMAERVELSIQLTGDYRRMAEKLQHIRDDAEE